jgi:hypothetical protein
MQKPAVTIGRLQLGPVCAKRAGLVLKRQRFRASEAVGERDSRQIDWLETEGIACK